LFLRLETFTRNKTSRICFSAHKHTIVPSMDHIYMLICNAEICAPEISDRSRKVVPVSNANIP
jgi:hypothetical protein